MLRIKFLSAHLKPFVLIPAAALLLQGCMSNMRVPEPEVVPNGVYIPINDPTQFIYNGEESGLYPWGNFLQSNSYRSTYVATCEALHPIAGSAGGNDKIVTLGIGASNPAIMFDGLLHAQEADAGFGSNTRFVNGAINAKDFSDILNPMTNYWDQVDSILAANNIDVEQVQVIFCIEDNLSDKDKTFGRVDNLTQNYFDLLSIIRDHFPNCLLFYVGDRGYTGYSDDPKHMEPVGYLNGWGAKNLVADYVNGMLPTYPVVNWLDYYWADGENARWDGLTYSPEDYADAHHIHFTQEKADALMQSTHEKLKVDAGAGIWYR